MFYVGISKYNTQKNRTQSPSKAHSIAKLSYFHHMIPSYFPSPKFATSESFSSWLCFWLLRLFHHDSNVSHPKISLSAWGLLTLEYPLVMPLPSLTVALFLRPPLWVAVFYSPPRQIFHSMEFTIMPHLGMATHVVRTKLAKWVAQKLLCHT